MLLPLVEVKMSLKYSLHVDNTNLWAGYSLPSQANVTSVYVCFSLKMERTWKNVDLWLFHFNDRRPSSMSQADSILAADQAVRRAEEA